MHCLTTNPQPQNDRLTTLLRARGARVTQLPLHEYTEPSDGGAAMRRVLHRATAGECDWLLFSSPRAVTAILARGLPAASSVQFGAVGDETAAALRAGGIEPTLVVAGGGQALATALLDRGVTLSTRIASFQAEAGRTDWHAALTARGAQLTHVPAYRLVAAPLAAAAWCAAHPDPLDAIPFTAPSAVERFVEQFAPHLTTAPFATTLYYAIGQTTAAALTAAHLPLTALAATPTFSALVAAVCGHENS